MRNTSVVLFCLSVCGLIGLAVADAVALETVIESQNDGELDEHVNWNSSPKGTQESMYVGRLADDYEIPVVGPSKFSVIKFDLSSLAGESITGTTLRLIQTADANSMPLRAGVQLAATTEVYGVVTGQDFDETQSSWLSYMGGTDDATRNAFLNSGAISYLGTMTNVSNLGGLSGLGAVTTFTDVDLTNLVKSWNDGTQANLGLLLLNTATFTGAPSAPGDIVARYATHESATFDGPQLIVSYGNVVPTPGDFNGDSFVDDEDLEIWQTAYGLDAEGDADGDQDSDGRDFLIWQRNVVNGPNFVSVPEPAAAMLAGVFLACGPLVERFKRRMQDV
jgi:hypothetical protein